MTATELGAFEASEVWQARAEQAEARVAALETDLDRHRDALSGLLGVPALVREGYCAACDCASGHHEEGCPVADACEVLATEVASARSVVLADTRVDELEAEAKALAEDRGKLMQITMAQTGETMRLRGACEQALSMLREDRPQAALALLEETTRA